MRSYTVHVELSVTGTSAQEVLAHGDRVMEALADVGDSNPELQDWTLSLDGAQGLCEFDLTVSAQHHADAIALAHNLVRTAIHAAGGATPECRTASEATRTPRYDDANNGIKVFA